MEQKICLYISKSWIDNWEQLSTFGTYLNEIRRLDLYDKPDRVVQPKYEENYKEQANFSVGRRSDFERDLIYKRLGKSV